MGFLFCSNLLFLDLTENVHFLVENLVDEDGKPLISRTRVNRKQKLVGGNLDLHVQAALDNEQNHSGEFGILLNQESRRGGRGFISLFFCYCIHLMWDSKGTSFDHYRSNRGGESHEETQCASLNIRSHKLHNEKNQEGNFSFTGEDK